MPWRIADQEIEDIQNSYWRKDNNPFRCHAAFCKELRHRSKFSEEQLAKEARACTECEEFGEKYVRS